jgi:hypothetical protein
MAIPYLPLKMPHPPLLRRRRRRRSLLRLRSIQMPPLLPLLR